MEQLWIAVSIPKSEKLEKEKALDFIRKLKEERMECNIGQDAVFLTHSEMPYFLGIFIKED
jgi:hypothetical protein